MRYDNDCQDYDFTVFSDFLDVRVKTCFTRVFFKFWMFFNRRRGR